MPKKQITVSIPRKIIEEYKALYKELKDVCDLLEISSAVELFRVHAMLGKQRFRQIAEEVRKSGTASVIPMEP